MHKSQNKISSLNFLTNVFISIFIIYIMGHPYKHLNIFNIEIRF